MNIPTAADVVIIGGGPTGSTAAADLARKGRDVVVLEKGYHPRDQVGESLIPDFWRFMDKIGVTDKILAEGFLAKAGAIMSWNKTFRGHTFGDFGFKRPAMHVERDRFDQIPFEHAGESGAKLFSGTTVRNVETGTNEDGSDYSRIAYTTDEGAEGVISAPVVIDASGQAGVISRQMGIRQINDEFRYLAAWGYFKNARYLTIDGEGHDAHEIWEHGPVTFVSAVKEAGDHGWSWHIQLREKTSIGLVIPLDVVKQARHEGESWEDYFLRKTSEVPVLRELLEPAEYIPGSFKTIRNYSSISTEFSGPGFLLAGDAAGFIDPIFSVGIVLAMYSGLAAAWAANGMLGTPDKADHIRRVYDHQLKGRIEVARSLALPRYTSDGNVSELAKETVKFERSGVKELMYVASTFTTRNENWVEMVGGTPPDLAEDQIREYEELNGVALATVAAG